jgi:hypothetical protein
MTENLLREVEEDMQQEEWLSFWRLYGPRIAAVLILTVLSTGGYFFWRWRHQAYLEEQSSQYEHALNLLDRKGPNLTSQNILMNLAKEKTKGYSLLARLQLFRLKRQTNTASEENFTDIVKQGEGVGRFARQEMQGGVEAMVKLSLAALHLNTGRPLPDSLRSDLSALKAPQSPWRESVLEMEGLEKIATSSAEEARRVCLPLLRDRSLASSMQMRLALALIGKGVGLGQGSES